MNYLPMYTTRLKNSILRQQLLLTDLFAPSKPDEHCLAPILTDLLSFLYSSTPQNIPNSKCFQKSEQPSFQWSIQLEGSHGCGKTALLRTLTRHSLLYTLPDRQPQSAAPLRQLQLDEKEFISALAFRFDRVLNPPQMTGITCSAELKFQKKRERKLKGTIDYQALGKQIEQEVVDLNESPLQNDGNDEQISVMAIDDCENFHISSLESLFDDFYKGASIRPLVFAVGGRQLSFNRAARQLAQKGVETMAFVWNQGWKAETDVVQKVQKVVRGGIDKFLLQSKKVDTNVVLEPPKAGPYSTYQDPTPKTINQQVKFPYYISRMLQTYRDQRYLDRLCSTEYLIEKGALNPRPYEIEKALQQPFYSVTKTKHHLTPIPSVAFFSLDQGFENVDDDIDPRPTTRSLLENCAKYILFAAVYSDQLIRVDDHLCASCESVVYDAAVFWNVVEELVVKQNVNLLRISSQAQYLVGSGDSCGVLIREITAKPANTEYEMEVLAEMYCDAAFTEQLTDQQLIPIHYISQSEIEIAEVVTQVREVQMAAQVRWNDIRLHPWE